MTLHEPPTGEPTPPRSDDPVADLRDAVDRVLRPVEEHLDEWDTGLSEALVSPTWTPLLRQQLDELHATARRCRELGDAMTTAAARLAATDPPPADDQQPPGGDAA
jgi:hypothetical protein